VRFLKPVAVGETVTVQAEVVEKKSRLIRASGVITGSGGETIATAGGRFLASKTSPGENMA
jgi:acyl dehydratase